MKTKKEVVHTEAKYDEEISYKNVLVNIPSEDDKQLKFIFAHIFTNGNREIVGVPCHLRRGIIFNGEFLTRRFYILPKFLGKTIVADEVKLISKYEKVDIDGFEFYQYTLIVDIIMYSDEENEPEYVLKCGSTKPEGFIIPRTDKFVNFEKIS